MVSAGSYLRLGASSKLMCLSADFNFVSSRSTRENLRLLDPFSEGLPD